ncbi:unnamed protein product [Hymenolepis diminuta]|uniref:Uncharacterized protein n=1 Tax=Hymenolepis diminuta TaxID=6216 RepID=A0A564Y1C1_HYMDI|nr:unnamed protein product [Hymenolepis diminuta]
MLPARPSIGALDRKIMVGVHCWDFEVADVQFHSYDIQPEELQEMTNDGVKILRSDERFLREYMKFVDDLYVLKTTFICLTRVRVRLSQFESSIFQDEWWLIFLWKTILLLTRAL